MSTMADTEYNLSGEQEVGNPKDDPVQLFLFPVQMEAVDSCRNTDINTVCFTPL